MSKQVITIGYLKDFIGDVVNINPSYTDMTYCPTYDELTNGNLVTNFKDNTLPLSIINGIYVNPNFTSSKTYSNDQLVIREHLQLKYVELQNIDIYADNTSISCCGSSTTLSATGYFKLVTKVEEGTLTTSTTQMSQAISAIYSDSASYTTINASTITFNKNSINYPTSNIATSRTSRVTGSYTYTFNGGKSIIKTNTIDITQNANNVGDWINTTTTTNSISVTPSSMLFSASGGEQTYTVTRYYTQYQEKYDSCSALIDANNFNTSSIVIPQNATTSGDFECTTTTVSVGVQDSGASERNGILTVFYDGKSATCSLTQSENLIGDWIKDGEPYEYDFSISISPKENLDCDGGETYATSILSWKQNYIIKDSLGNIVYSKTENESNNVTNNTTWSSDRGTINSNGKLTFPMSIEDGITKTNVTGKYSSFTDTDYITQLNCSSENYCILGITNTQNGGVNQEVSINEGDMTEIKIYSIDPYGNETIPSISSSKPYDSNLISVTASEYNASNDFSRNFNIIAKKYDGNDTYKTTNITINNECAEYVIPIKILKVDFTAITTEYDIRVLSTTIGCCDTSANVTVEGCSRTGKTHTDGTATEWGNWSSWSQLSSSNYSLSYSKEIEENDTNAEQIYTVTATGKGNYNGKTASATITQEAGPCAEVNCFTLNIDGRNWELSLPNKATSDVTYKFNATNGHVNNNLTYPNWTQTIVVNEGESFSSLRTDENTFCSNATLISISPEYDNEYIYMCNGIINIGGNEVTSTTYEYRASVNTIGKCETTTTATVYYTPTYHYSDGTSTKGSEAIFNGSKTLSYKYHDDSKYGSIDVNNNIHLLDVDVKITFTHNGSQQEIITSTTQDAGPCTCECEVESISVNPSTYSYSSLTELKTFYVTITDNSNYCDECNGGFTVYDSNGLVIDNGTSSFSLSNTGGTYTIKSNDDPSKTCILTLIEYEKPTITVTFSGTRTIMWTEGMDEYYGCEGSNDLPEMIVTDSDIRYTIEGVSSVPDELRFEISSINYSVGNEYSGSTSYKPSSLSGKIIIPSCSRLVSSDICSKVEQECQPESWIAELTSDSNYTLEVIDKVENKEADAIISSTTYEYRAEVSSLGCCDTTTTTRVYCTPTDHYSDGSSVEGAEFEITSKTLYYRYSGETSFKASLSENETSSPKDVEVKITFTHNGSQSEIITLTTQSAGPCTSLIYEYDIRVLNTTIGCCDTSANVTVQGRSRTGTTYADGSATEWSDWSSWSQLSSSNYTLSYSREIEENNTNNVQTYTVTATGKGNYNGKSDSATITQEAGPCTCECVVESISVNPSTYSYSSLTELKTFYVTIIDNSETCECNGGFTVYKGSTYITSGTSSFSLSNTGGTYTIKSNDDPSKTCTLTLTEFVKTKTKITVKFNGTRNVIWTAGMDEYYGCEWTNELPEMIVTDSNITYTIEGVSSVPDELRIEITSITYSVGYEYSGSTSYKPSSLSGNIIIPSCSRLVSSDICSKVEQECQPEIWDADLTNDSNYELEVINNVKNIEDATITSTTYEYRASVNTMGKCDTTTTARVYCTPTDHYSDGSSVEGTEFEITSKTLTYRYTSETSFKASLSENETSSPKDVEVKITFTHNGQANIINEKTTQAAGPCTPTCTVDYIYDNAILDFNVSNMDSCDTAATINNVKITNVLKINSDCSESIINETPTYNVTYSPSGVNTGSSRQVGVTITTSSAYGNMSKTKYVTQSGGCCDCIVNSIRVTPSSYSYTSSTDSETFYVTITDNGCDECNGGFTVYKGSTYITDGTSSFNLSNTGGTYTIKSNDDPSKTCTLTLTEFVKTKTKITVTFSGTRTAIWTNGMDEGYGCEGSNELPEKIISNSDIRYTIEGVSSVPSELKFNIESLRYHLGKETTGSTSYTPSSLSGEIITPSCTTTVSSDICYQVEQSCQPESWDAYLTNDSNYELEVIDDTFDE